MLDGRLVLAGGRHDLRVPDEAVIADLVAMEQEPAWCLGRPGRDAWARRPPRLGDPGARGKHRWCPPPRPARGPAPLREPRCCGRRWCAARRRGRWRSAPLRQAGGVRSPARVTRDGPEQVRHLARVRPRLQRVGPADLVLSERRASQSVGARSIPSLDTIRPSFIGYSVGWRRATSRGSRTNSGAARPGDARGRFPGPWPSPRQSAGRSASSLVGAWARAENRPRARSAGGWAARRRRPPGGCRCA